MYANTENDIGSADLMLYMGFIGPNYSSGGGIAYLATVCEGDSYRKYKQSINNYGTSHSSMGELLAHEVGHNLGKLTEIYRAYKQHPSPLVCDIYSRFM